MLLSPGAVLLQLTAERGGLTHDGKPCPTWAEMRPDIKLGWCAAAVGAIEVFTGVTTEPAADPATRREPSAFGQEPL